MAATNHLKCVLFCTSGAKGKASFSPSFFPRVFPLSDQSGKLKGTSEKPWGVPAIFLAPYFVKQKYVFLAEMLRPKASTKQLTPHLYLNGSGHEVYL